MKNQFKIHDHFINTEFGTTIQMNLRPELMIDNNELNLAERWVQFIETKTLTKKVILSECLMPYFKRAELDCELYTHPQSMGELLTFLEPEPVWVLAGSKENCGLIAVLISSGKDFFYNHECTTPSEIVIGISSNRPLIQIESLDLSRTGFTHEQQLILCLAAVEELYQLPCVKASHFKIYEYEREYQLNHQIKPECSFKNKTLDFSMHYYIDEDEVRNQIWSDTLIQANLSETPFPCYRPDYTEFINWAELWLQDQPAALRYLDNCPPSPFLFHALILHGDPKLLGREADKLISIEAIELKEAMDLIFDQTVNTRSGLSATNQLKFIAYDPEHVRYLCENLPVDYWVKRRKETTRGEGLALNILRCLQDRIKALQTPL